MIFILRGENCLLVFVSVVFTRINNCRLTYKYNINKYLQTSILNFTFFTGTALDRELWEIERDTHKDTKIYIYDPTPYLI